MKNGSYELVIAPKNYPGKKYRGRYAYEHHIVFWKYKKTIIKNEEIIHHKNNNKRDNRIENLELLTNQDHSKLHARGKSQIELCCPICAKTFKKELRQFKKRLTSCSKFCGYKLGHITRMKKLRGTL